MSSTLIKRPLLYFIRSDFDKFFQTYYQKQALDKDGNTLAHLCVMHNKLDYLPMVSEDMQVKNNYGMTPVDLGYHLGRDLSSVHVQEVQDVKIGIYRNIDERFDVLDKDGIKEAFKIDYLDHIEFKNSSILNWVFKQTAKRLSNLEIKWKNHWTCCMYEKDFLAKRLPNIYIKWVNPLIGYGLFAQEEIPQYTYIGEYTGIVRKRSTKSDLVNDYIFSYVVGSYDTPYVVDAKNQGNYTRFLNHSDNPNLCSTWMASEGMCHIILFASRTIAKGEQLTYDYGPHYWKKRTSPIML